MFVRVKTKGPYRYLQIVENHREGKRTLQRVLATLGRADELAESGGVDVLLKSLGRFATRVRVIEGYEQGRLQAVPCTLLALTWSSAVSGKNWAWTPR